MNYPHLLCIWLISGLFPSTLTAGRWPHLRTYGIRLSAVVTRPSMELFSTHLDFATVKCGQCKIITIRIHNPFHVK